jgi:hypothetical protein
VSDVYVEQFGEYSIEARVTSEDGPRRVVFDVSRHYGDASDEDGWQTDVYGSIDEDGFAHLTMALEEDGAMQFCDPFEVGELAAMMRHLWCISHQLLGEGVPEKVGGDAN